MNESSVYSYLKSLLVGKTLLSRIESCTGNGVPDVACAIKSAHHWIEVKYLKEWPKRETTLVKLPLRPEQKLWIATRGELSGNVWVFIRIEDDFFLLTWKEAIQACNGWTRDEWKVMAYGSWYFKVDKYTLYSLIAGGC